MRLLVSKVSPQTLRGNQSKAQRKNLKSIFRNGCIKHPPFLRIPRDTSTPSSERTEIKMKHNLQNQCFQKKPTEGGVVRCRRVSLRERLLWHFFSVKKRRVMVIVPGDSVEWCIHYGTASAEVMKSMNNDNAPISADATKVKRRTPTRSTASILSARSFDLPGSAYSPVGYAELHC